MSANKIGKKENVISIPALSQLSIGSIASGLVIVVSWERYGRAITKRKIKASILTAKDRIEKIFFSFIILPFLTKLKVKLLRTRLKLNSKCNFILSIKGDEFLR